MEIYKVGGCVRDSFLARPCNDIDYVVVGSSTEEMLSLGYAQVGKSFPVFLHPSTKDQYALARTETKIGKLHTDFVCNCDNISLVDDLRRRDFTINAIAQDLSGNIIDPFNGQEDIKNKIIRCVNNKAFVEDPLRILRALRFAAQLDFTLDSSTEILIISMVKKGYLKNLTSERVFVELEKALCKSSNSSVFFRYALKLGVLKALFPKLALLAESIENPLYHPEGNSFEHTLLTLDVAREYDSKIKWGLLFHDIEKSQNLKDFRKYKHDIVSKGTETFIKKLGLPRLYNEYIIGSIKYHMRLRQIKEMRLSKQYDLLYEVSNKFKNDSFLESMWDISILDSLGRKLDENTLYAIKKDLLDKKQYCIDLCTFFKSIKFYDIPNNESILAKNRGIALRNYRICRLKKYLNAIQSSKY